MRTFMSVEMIKKLHNDVASLKLQMITLKFYKGECTMEKQSLQSFKEFQDEKFTKRIIFKKGESTVFLLNFMPGQELPEHAHPGTEVYLLVLDGEGTFIIDGKEIPVSANDVVHCGGDEKLAFKNSGSMPVSLYVMLNKIPNEKYAENI